MQSGRQGSLTVGVHDWQFALVQSGIGCVCLFICVIHTILPLQEKRRHSSLLSKKQRRKRYRYKKKMIHRFGKEKWETIAKERLQLRWHERSHNVHKAYLVELERKKPATICIWRPSCLPRRKNTMNSLKSWPATPRGMVIKSTEIHQERPKEWKPSPGIERSLSSLRKNCLTIVRMAQKRSTFMNTSCNRLQYFKSKNRNPVLSITTDEFPTPVAG